MIITRDYASILELAEADLRDMDAVRRIKSTTTTIIQKLRPRLSRGDAGGCPVLGGGDYTRHVGREVVGPVYCPRPALDSVA